MSIAIPDTARPELVVARELARQGRPADAVRRAVRAGTVVRLAAGVTLPRIDWEAMHPAARRRARIEAVAATLPGTVFCRESAGLLHGVPTIGSVPEVPTALVPRGGSDSTSYLRRIERAIDVDTEERDGKQVTSLTVTTIDLAASRSLLGSVVALDHALAQGVGRDAIHDTVQAWRPFRGVARVERALQLATGLAESPLETLVWVRLHDLGYMLPTPQLEMDTVRGRYRVDFAWDGGRLVLEADGRAKYESLAAEAGREGREVLWAEKRRGDALQLAGARLARVTWEDAYRGDGLRRALVALGVPRVRAARPLTY